MSTSDGQVNVTFTVKGTTTTTTVASHGPLPLTGAPLVAEVTTSLGLVGAGVLAAIAARRRKRSTR